ncbi:hypothetical protein SFRURICE_017422, partial [Spodoptera frugiperda]
EHETCDATVHKSDARTRPNSYEREYHDKVPTMATLSGTGVVTHTAPSYEEQRANPALLSRGASGTPGGRSVRDDGYCSASSTPRAFDNKSTKGSVVTLSCYKKEPKIQIEEECFYSEPSKKLRTNSIKPEDGDGRETWGTGADFLLSIIGFAVDLANVWRFPYLCYRNGGGVGFCAVMVAFYVSFYYNVIIGWAFYFLVSSARSELPWVHCDNSWNTEQCWDSGRVNGTNRTDVRYQGPLSHFTPASEFFHRAVLEMQHSEGLNDLGFPKWQLAICLGLVYVTLYLSLFKGVKSSGKVVWMTATMPYVVLSILLARGLLLPGATRGIAYYLQPELTRLKDTQVWVDAAVQIFYSVGAGFGVHLSYASYNTFHNNCYRDCLVTTLVNCFTSFFSGFVIFTYLGFMSHKQGVPISSVATEGPGLVFQVYPEAVATLPGASLWAMLFFFMLIMLGLDSGMGGLECVITGLLDQARACGATWLRREHFTLIVVCVVASTCSTCWTPTLLVYPCSAPHSSKRWLSPGSMEMLGFRPGIYWRICWKFVSPTFIIGVVVFGLLYQQPLQYQHYTYPPWAVVLGWGLACSSILMIPIVAIYKLISTPGTFRQRLACCISPESEHEAIRGGAPVSRFSWKHWLYRNDFYNLFLELNKEIEYCTRSGVVYSNRVKMSLERDSVGGVPSVGDIRGVVGPTAGGAAADPRSQLLQEMREQNFDLIRFASYRTACKLLHVIDIWNVIEAFRENALNTLEPTACVNVTRLETLVSSLYHNLNKRLPPAHQVSVEACSALLLNWLLSAYSTGDNVGKIRVFSIKVALATMCAGKLMDKLRYIFSQLSDGNGHLLMKRLSDYLRENGKITVNDFLDTLMSDPGPPCLVWLPLLHRLASVENGIAEHLSRGVDDEHRLIARYAARLAHENRTMGRSSSEGSEVDAARQQRELISQLEAKNREIMREIARLRRQQEAEASAGGGVGSAPLVSELRLLRQRKDELEGHLSSLQESRKHLMHQLEGLMRMLKTQQSSPRSTPNSSPRSTKSPPLPGTQPQPSAPEREPPPRGTVRSAPQTPSLGERERIDMSHSLGMESMGGDARNFHQNQRPTTMGIDNRSLRSDLLYAADSVTNAMSTLVRELNSEGSDTEGTVKGDSRKQRDFEEDDDSDEPMPRPQPPRHYLHDNNVQQFRFVYFITESHSEC